MQIFVFLLAYRQLVTGVECCVGGMGSLTTRTQQLGVWQAGAAVCIWLPVTPVFLQTLRKAVL